MKQLPPWSVLASLLALAGCAAEEGVLTAVHEDAPRAPREESGLALTAQALVSSDASGRLVLTRAEGGVPWGDAPLDQALVDLVPTVGGVLAATRLDEATAFAHFGVGAHRLGPADPRGWLDGDVRVLPLPTGLLGFEEAHGPRWRLWGDAASTPSRACGRPSSLVVHARAHHDEVVALVQDAGRPPRIARARVDASGVGPCDERPLTLPWLPHAPRLLPVGEATLVIDPHAGGIELGWLGDDASIAGFAHLPVVAGRAADAIAIALGDGPPLAHLALLLEGPARLVVLALEPDPSSPPSVTEVAGLPLPGAPRAPERLFFRSLAAAGARLFAATDEGVFTVDVRHGDVGLALETDGTEPLAPNALRGPIAVVDAP